MQFENIVGLARDTPTSVLCRAWGEDAADVRACKKGERPMTIRQVGALAEVHGLTLLDVLAI
ncbi:helix-turn-helix DNA binding domain protein [Arthrobacter phage Shoya]|uniref:Helix-turn-helix DNA binding domain protein n=1 Tax=Arthrobacter phage Shoya TaxID=2704035 RepID=A0A6G6XHW9_9CAUD|nr:helix-turn-helix DNA binding domain protein [Arthrobacter phage Shoya]QIG57709.1 helix-turn-helix DNA binding domain protein [Arthrobacter phage Shoya]